MSPDIRTTFETCALHFVPVFNICLQWNTNNTNKNRNNNINKTEVCNGYFLFSIIILYMISLDRTIFCKYT